MDHHLLFEDLYFMRLTLSHWINKHCQMETMSPDIFGYFLRAFDHFWVEAEVSLCTFNLTLCFQDALWSTFQREEAVSDRLQLLELLNSFSDLFYLFVVYIFYLNEIQLTWQFKSLHQETPSFLWSIIYARFYACTKEKLR